MNTQRISLKTSLRAFSVLIFNVLALTTAIAQEGFPLPQRPLSAALNPDGSIRTGTGGSYSTEGYAMMLRPNGAPVFVAASSSSVTESWDDQFYGQGPSGWVYAICVSGSDVYVGGTFTSVNNIAANYVAKWDGNSWSDLGSGGGNGVNSHIYSIAVSGSNVYVGGIFSAANWGGTFVNAFYVAKWNGSSWSGLTSGDGNGVNNIVYAIAIIGSNVYVGGDFTQANYLGTSPLPVNKVARWDGSNWNVVGTGGGNGVSGTVRSMAVSGTDLYLGGTFIQANVGGTTVDAGRIVKWDGANWSALGTGAGLGVNGAVLAVDVSGPNVWVGGQFTQANFGGTVVPANYVALWNGSNWSSLGSSGGNGMNSFVGAIAVSGSNVYVGGNVHYGEYWRVNGNCE